MKLLYKCLNCGWIYDEDVEGVLWEDVDDSCVCQSCFSDKDAFIIVDADDN